VTFYKHLTSDPQALPPYSGTQVQVFHIHQTWRSGSSAVGSGLIIQYDNLHYYNNEGVLEVTTH